MVLKANVSTAFLWRYDVKFIIELKVIIGLIYIRDG